jgi:GNAT superfamily N-acetyltransferase
MESIASTVNIHEYSHHNRGFLVYTLTATEYRKRIADGQYVFLFDYKGEPVGFVCGYDDEGLDRYYRDETLSHESSVCRAVMEAARKQGDRSYLFLDQISVLPSMQNRGLGERYFDLFCKHIRGPFYVAMLEAPIRNPRIDFWLKRGFKRLGYVDEVLPERFSHHASGQTATPNLRWGIYLLEDWGYHPQRS